MKVDDKEGMVVEQQTTTVATPNRDKLLKGLQKRGSKLADDADYEAIIGEAMPRYKELENGHRAMSEDNAMILDAIASNPEAGKLLDELLGVDKDGNSKFVDEVKKRAERIAGDKKVADDMVANLNVSFDNMEEALTELEATEEEKAAVIDLINNLISGNISKQMIRDYVQGLRHDDDVDDAKVAGLVEGKNSVIDKSKLELREGDDLPKPKNSSTPKPEPKPEGDGLPLGTRINPANYMRKIS
jgi:hypothetical protein